MSYLEDKHRCYVLVGSQGSGKTHLTKYIVSQIAEKYNYIILFCGSGITGMLQYDYLDQDYCFDEYDEDMLKKIMEASESSSVKLLLIFDDVLGKVDFHHSNIFSTLIANQRHLGIDIILLCQYYKEVNPRIRSMTNRIFMFRTMNSKTLTDLSDEFSAADTDRKRYIISTISTLPQYYYCMISPKGPIEELFVLDKAPDEIEEFMVVTKDDN